jgi:hypothetical protein
LRYNTEKPAMSQTLNVDKDAFSSGQVGSKLWLCEELERLNWHSKLTYIYGGWYGVTAFLLLSRGKFNVDKIRSLDVDPLCQEVADMINENWVWQDWKFKAFTQDCNNYEGQYGDLIINTSTEHFDSTAWFDRIPSGTRVVLQGNNMPHDDHHIHSNSKEDFALQFPLREINFLGEKQFVYPSWQFTRYMLVGTK